MNDKLFENFFELDEVDSTNAEAKRIALENKGLNFVLWAKSQKKGRGQAGNSWYSSDNKDVAVSFVYYPENINVLNQFDLNLLVCNAVHFYVSQCVKDKIVQIKWPNDILIDNKKVAGILIENSVKGTKMEQCIIGIGLNLNSEVFPTELVRATSLRIENPSFNSTPKQAIFSIGECLEKLIRIADFTEAKAYYLNYLFAFQKLQQFKVKGQITEGIIKGVESNGQLLVLTQQGQQSFGFKEIEFIY